MKVRIAQKDFQMLLEQAGLFIDRRASLPVLLHVLLRATRGRGFPRLIATATNLEHSIATWLLTDVEEEGEVLVEAKPLLEFVKSLPKDGEVVLETHTKTVTNEYGEYEEVTLTVRCGGAEMTFRHLHDELPLPDKIRGAKISTFADQFLLALRVVPFASKDPARPALQGVLFDLEEDTLHLVATDGYRLAHATVPVQVPEGLEIPKYRWIVPAAALAKVEKILRKQKYDGAIHIQPHFPEMGVPRTALRWAGVSVVTDTIDSVYPTWEQILQETRNATLHVMADERDLSRAVKALKTAAKEASNVIRVRVNGVLQMSASASEIGETKLTVPADIQGHASGEEDYIIGLNYRYLQDVLKALKKRQVIMSFLPDNTRPVHFTARNDPNFEYIQMPMRLG